MNNRNIITDDLRTSNYMGTVVDISDPLKRGRVKVNIFGKFDDLDIEDIPWAEPKYNNTGGSTTGGGYYSLPKLGSLVEITFDNGNIYCPLYGSNIKLSDDLIKELTDEDYKNTHSLIFDTELEGGPLKIWFTPSKGLLLELGTSNINIRKDLSISITSDNGKVLHIKKDSISLGKENESDQPGVLGNTNEDVLKMIVQKMDDILSMINKFATTEGVAVTSAFVLAPLAAGLSTLLAESAAKKLELVNIKNKIPETKSKSVTLDK